MRIEFGWKNGSLIIIDECEKKHIFFPSETKEIITAVYSYVQKRRK